MEDFITFQEAREILQCDPVYLSKQIDCGKIEYAIDSSNPKETRYRLSRRDVLQISRPTPKAAKTSIVNADKASAAYRRARQLRELRQEAADAGLSLEEYRRFVSEL